MTNFVFIIMSLLGGLVQGATGFGFALVTMSVLPFFINLGDLTIITIILGVVVNISILIGLKGGVNTKLMIVPLLTSIVGRWIGTHILIRYDVEYLRIILSIVIVVISIYFIFLGDIKIKPTKMNGGICGITSGVLGGMYSMPGPPLVIYYFSVSENSREYSATTQVTILISSIYSLILHHSYGNLNIYNIKMSLVGATVVFLGSLAGTFLFKKINKRALRRIIYIILIIMGFATMFKLM